MGNPQKQIGKPLFLVCIRERKPENQNPKRESTKNNEKCAVSDEIPLNHIGNRRFLIAIPERKREKDFFQ
jgi:hypothetical protein